MIISAPVTEVSPDQEYKQVVKLKNGLYGGMFARYSQPKEYDTFDRTAKEMKFYVSFVVTHDAAAQQLKYFSEAFTGIRLKIYYDPTSGRMSSYVAFLAAISGKEWTPAAVVEAARNGKLPDLDTLIGRPAQLYISPAAKADKKGLYVNNIDTMRGGFEKVTPVLAKAIHPLFKAAEFDHNKEDGRCFLVKPTTAYQEDVVEEEAPLEDPFDDSEVPF